MLESLFSKVADLQTPTQVFSCEYYVIFKNTYFEEHFRTAASGNGVFFPINQVQEKET